MIPAPAAGERLRGGLSTALAVWWLAVFPLVSLGSYAGFTQAKWLFLLGGAALTLTAAIAILALTVRFRLPRPEPLPLILCGALTVWIALSAFLGSGAQALNPDGQRVTLWGESRFEGLLTQVCYAVVFLAQALAPVRARIVRAAVAVSLALNLALTALQYAGLNPLGFFPEGFSLLQNPEFQGSLGNIDMTVGYLALALPLLLLPWCLRGEGYGSLAAGLAGVLWLYCMEVQAGFLMLGALLALALALALRRPVCRPRVCGLWAACALLLLARLSLSLPWENDFGTLRLCPPGGPAALAALLTALLSITLGVLAHRCPGGRPVSAQRIALGFAALAALAVLLVWLLPVPENAGGLWEAHEILRGRGLPDFGSERWGIWEIALRLARSHPLFGVGPDAFQQAALDEQAASGIYLAQLFDTPHNLLLGVLVSSGIPALLLYLALLAALLRRTRRAGEAGIPLAAALVCYLTQGMFTFSLCIITPIAAALAGMAAAVRPMEESADVSELKR